MFKYNGINISKHDWINIGIHAGWVKASHLKHAPNVYELTAHIVHYNKLYKKLINPLIHNLSIKLKKGLFNREMGVLAFEKAAKEGIKIYTKEHGEMSVNDMLVRSVAENLFDYYIGEIHDELFNLQDDDIVMTKNNNEAKKNTNKPKRRDKK
jgi:hypothetical protein